MNFSKDTLTDNSGAAVVGLIVVAGLVLLLLAGGITTQYIRTQVIPPGQEVQKSFSFSVPNDPTLIGNIR